jgi:uncharacterized protein DUF4440
MKRTFLFLIAGTLAILHFLPAAHLHSFVVRADDDSPVRQADQALVQSFAKADTAGISRLLDSEFTWIDSNGKSLTREQALEALPRLANSDVEPQVRSYGNTAVVRASRGQMHVLRIWAKREAGWRVVLYQEVKQVEKSQPPAPAQAGSSDCVNPCKSIPFEPATQSEKEAIASWQGVMGAMANNDADAYAPLIADEFTATDTHHDRPYTKPDRLAQIRKQKLAGTRSLPPELISARMFDFGDTVMMIAREQRPGAKPYFNTRMWVKRDSWQMLFSFNTRIE